LDFFGKLRLLKLHPLFQSCDLLLQRGVRGDSHIIKGGKRLIRFFVAFELKNLALFTQFVYVLNTRLQLTCELG
jgi:hypothetical protein